MRSHTERVTALRTILATAEGIKKLLPLGTPPPSIPHSPVSIPPLNLPIPDDVTSALDLMKDSHQLLKKAASKIFDSLNEIRTLHTKNYQQVCQKILNQSSKHEKFLKPFPIVFNDLRRAYESSYTFRYLPWFRDQINSVNAAVAKLARKRPAFKNEYTPLLDEFFEQNAYPSASERLTLAEQTKMTPRQIEVWFQNHRNRSHRPLKRAANNKLACQMQEEVLQKPADIGFQYEQRSRVYSPFSDRGSEVASESTESNPLDTSFHTSPPYAFPSLYPPTCDKDPFPTVNGRFIFPEPVWMRSSTTSVKTPSVSVNFDDFVTAFATKLTIRDGLSCKFLPKCARPPVGRLTGTYIRPSPAPHPALIRRARMPLLSNLPSPMPRFGQTSLRCISPPKSPPFVKRAPRVESSMTWSCQGGSNFRSASSSSVSSIASSDSETSSFVITPPSSPSRNLPEISDPFDDSEFFNAFNIPSNDFTTIDFPITHVPTCDYDDLSLSTAFPDFFLGHMS